MEVCININVLRCFTTQLVNIFALDYLSFIFTQVTRLNLLREKALHSFAVTIQVIIRNIIHYIIFP